MDKRRSPAFKGGMFSSVNNLPLMAKLLLVAMLPIMVILGVILPMSANGLDQLESKTNLARLEDEVRIIGGQFAQVEANLINEAGNLSSNPALLDAVTRGDEAALNPILILARVGANLSHLQAVDRHGQVIGIDHRGYGQASPEEFQRLRDLGLIEVQATELLPTPRGWLLAVVRPLKTRDELVGALLLGRLLDAQVLSEVNFNRTDPRLALFDSQGETAVVTGANAEHGADEVFAVDPDRRARAGGGLALLNEDLRVAYAPLLVGKEPAAVFGVALSTEATASLRQKLVANYLFAMGLTTMFVLAGAYVVARMVSSPIMKLKEAAMQFGAGNLDARVEIKAGAEAGTLAKAFNEMAASLQKTMEELTVSNRELRDFTSIAAHDLQEPLRKVEAFGDRLEAKCGDLLTDQGRDYLSRMQNASGRMRSLIDDLLQLSRVTTKGEPFAPVDLDQVAQEVLSDLEVRIEQVGGRVEVHDLPTIYADPTQMRQLLQNLIGNALKFSRPEEPPVVKIHGQRLDGPDGGPDGVYPADGLCEIIVQDNGIGFEEKYLDRLFNMFQRLHGRGEYEGNGVGLAVCRKIAERHGGKITAQGAKGEGAKFTVTLPMTHRKDHGVD